MRPSASYGLAGEAHTRALVAGGHTVGVEDRDAASAFGVAGSDLDHRDALGAGGFVYASDEIGLFGDAHRRRGDRDVVQPALPRRGERRGRARTRPRRARERGGQSQKLALADAVGVAVEGRPVADDAQTGAALRPELRALEPAIVAHQRQRPPLLAEQLAELTTVREKTRQHTFGDIGSDQRGCLSHGAS